MIRATEYTAPKDYLLVRGTGGRVVHIASVEAFAPPVCGAVGGRGWKPWASTGGDDLVDFYASFRVCPKCARIMADRAQRVRKSEDE